MSALEMSSAGAGVPRRDIRPKMRGNKPSFAIAIGTWPAMRIHPLSAPKQAIAAPAATALRAQPPMSTCAASANGAGVVASVFGSITLITPTVLTR